MGLKLTPRDLEIDIVDFSAKILNFLRLRHLSVPQANIFYLNSAIFNLKVYNTTNYRKHQIFGPNYKKRQFFARAIGARYYLPWKCPTKNILAPPGIQDLQEVRSKNKFFMCANCIYVIHLISNIFK